MYFNENMYTNFQTQLSRKLQRFRIYSQNKKCSIFHELSEYQQNMATFFLLDWSFKVLPLLLGTLPPEIPDYNNGSTLGCPTGWTKSSINSKRCYNIYSSTTSQNLAQTQCAKFFGSLLSIQNAFENNAVQSLFLYYL
jgi:hypothetical protein